jgi:hypothetical protein
MFTFFRTRCFEITCSDQRCSTDCSVSNTRKYLNIAQCCTKLSKDLRSSQKHTILCLWWWGFCVFVCLCVCVCVCVYVCVCECVWRGEMWIYILWHMVRLCLIFHMYRLEYMWFLSPLTSCLAILWSLNCSLDHPCDLYISCHGFTNQ